MQFKFECRHCGQRIAAIEEQIGTSAVCPNCKAEFRVPSPSPNCEPELIRSTPSNAGNARTWAFVLPVLCLGILVYGVLYPTFDVKNFNVGYLFGYSLPTALVTWGILKASFGKKLGDRNSWISFFALLCSSMVSNLIGAFQLKQASGPAEVKPVSAITSSSGTAKSLSLPSAISAVTKAETKSTKFGNQVARIQSNPSNLTTGTSKSTQTESMDGKGIKFIPKSLFLKVRPSVVVITTKDKNGNAKSLGTGFAVGDGAKIITNLHVVAGASSVIIKTSEGVLMNVDSILGLDEARDLAVLISPSKIPPIPIATVKSEVGDSIIAVGNPKGLEASLSEGLISGIRESGNTIFYQISASISPGSSGGPIINANGEVVAVSSFYFKDGQNLNFGIPTSFVKPLLEKTGKISISELAPQTDSLLHEFQEIRSLWKQDLRALALEKSRILLKENSNNRSVTMFVGGLYIDAQDWNGAIPLLEQTIALKPELAVERSCWLKIGQAYNAKKDFRSALRALKHLEDSTNPECLEYLFVTALAASSIDYADEISAKILALPPSNRSESFQDRVKTIAQWDLLKKMTWAPNAVNLMFMPRYPY